MALRTHITIQPVTSNNNMVLIHLITLLEHQILTSNRDHQEEERKLSLHMRNIGGDKMFMSTKMMNTEMKSIQIKYLRNLHRFSTTISSQTLSINRCIMVSLKRMISIIDQRRRAHQNQKRRISIRKSIPLMMILILNLALISPMITIRENNSIKEEISIEMKPQILWNILISSIPMTVVIKNLQNRVTAPVQMIHLCLRNIKRKTRKRRKKRKKIKRKRNKRR